LLTTKVIGNSKCVFYWLLSPPHYPIRSKTPEWYVVTLGKMADANELLYVIHQGCISQKASKA